jgi:UMF1 family MFS transporter
MAGPAAPAGGGTERMTEKARRVQIAAWCLYDFADSSFTTLIVTVSYGLYFRSVVAGHLGPAADFYWGLSIAISMAAVALATPVLGAIADLSGLRRRFLRAFALVSVAATASLLFVREGDLAAGMALFIVANVGYEGAHVFYNGFLPDLASDDRMGRISGYGWSFGYIGGLAALLLAHPLTRGGFAAGAVDRYRLVFPLVAGFFLLFALPALVLLRERPGAAPADPHSVRAGFRRLRATIGRLRELSDLARFLVAFVIYNDGVATVIAFSAIYAMQVIGFTVAEVTLLFIVTQLTAFAGAMAAGFAVDRIGARATIALSLMLWIAVVLGAWRATTVPVFFAVAVGASIGMGATQTASRSLMGLLIPSGHNAEFFGFYAFTGKVSAIAGPLLYGGVTALAGSERPAVLSLALFFIAGLLLLAGVDVERGRRAAGRVPGPPPSPSAVA